MPYAQTFLDIIIKDEATTQRSVDMGADPVDAWSRHQIRTAKVQSMLARAIADYWVPAAHWPRDAIRKIEVTLEIPPLDLDAVAASIEKHIEARLDPEGRVLPPE